MSLEKYLDKKKVKFFTFGVGLYKEEFEMLNKLVAKYDRSKSKIVRALIRKEYEAEFEVER